jgi:CRISPR-associated exonuclease Cas4
VTELPDPIPISALQHVVYCPRQAGLIHLERLWEENRFTAEGRILHEVVDKPAGRRTRGVRRVSALPVASQRLGLAGVADVVEFHAVPGGETPYPIEFKRGKPKAHRADEVQLCAQALCLEEMTGCAAPEGALFYGETKRRETVAFDVELRALTEAAAAELSAMFASRVTPQANYRAARCRACSLIEPCMPRIARRAVADWRARALDALLAEGA